jgi:hypothetical protein
MNITQLQLASNIPATENNFMLNEYNLIFIGAIIGFLAALLVLIIHYICRKKLIQQAQQSEPPPLEITI